MSLYTPLEEAREEIRRRWQDADLRQRVQKFVADVPIAFGSGPRAVYYRSLATPNFECLLFVQSAKALGQQPLVLEYVEDKFCGMNPDKIAMGKLTFHHGKGKCNGDRTSTLKTIEFNHCSGRRLDRITTVSGLNFIGVHRQILGIKVREINRFDLSGWCKAHGGTPAAYYTPVMALFIAHGILFENFLTEGDEGRFTRDIVWPAFEKVTHHFGLKPLIVRLRPEESENDPYWCWYPGELEAEVHRMPGLPERSRRGAGAIRSLINGRAGNGG